MLFLGCTLGAKCNRHVHARLDTHVHTDTRTHVCTKPRSQRKRARGMAQHAHTHTRTHTHAQHKLPSCVKQSHGSIACAPRRAKPAVAALRPQHTHCVPGAPTNTHAPRSRSSRLRGPARTASNARHNASVLEFTHLHPRVHACTRACVTARGVGGWEDGSQECRAFWPRSQLLGGSPASATPPGTYPVHLRHSRVACNY